MRVFARPTALMLADSVCVVLSAYIVYYACRDWPERHAAGTLSWTVTGFFVTFVIVSIAGLIAAAVYRRSNNRIARHIATFPVALAASGLLVGCTKLMLTGDF